MAPYRGIDYSWQWQQCVVSQYQSQIEQTQRYFEERYDLMRRCMGIDQKHAFDTIENLQHEIADLKEQMAHYKKGGFMKKPANFSKFFDEDYDCKEHSDYKCAECYTAMINDQSTSLALVTSSIIAGEDGLELEQQKLDAQESLERKLSFVKKALNMSDPTLKKRKMKELPELMKKAQDEITIGATQELLEEYNRKVRGVIKGFLRFFLKARQKR